MKTVRAYIGLGANVGDARATLTAAVHALAELPRAAPAGVSRLYVTSPVEVTDQADFHNAVVALDLPAGPGRNTGPIALLLALKSLEHDFGRRQRRRHGPRELDLDVLLFGDERLAVTPAGGRPLAGSRQGRQPARSPAPAGTSPALRAGTAVRSRAGSGSAGLARIGGGGSRRGRNRSRAPRPCARSVSGTPCLGPGSSAESA